MSNALYLETDEDITSAVDKLKAAEGDEVSIVVPKRSTLLQSMINLKLLKKAADDSKKNLVLVTNDRLSSHLAGRVGLAVADKLGADAKIPETELKEPDQTEVIDGGVAETGVVAAAAVAGAAVATDKADDETLDLPTEDKVGEASEPNSEPVMKTKAVSEDEPKKAKPKTGRVPDFNALQKKVLWGAIAVAVLITLFVVNFFLTSANVTIYAKGNQVPISTSFTADPASATDVTKGILKAQALSSSKDLTEQVAATGKQDVGTKASGTMTISNHCYNPGTLPVGTTFTSGDGHKFVSTSDVAVPNALTILGVCHSTSATVSVNASANGDSYNLGPTGYSVASIPSSGSSYVTFAGSQMSGGVSKTVTVVAQSDIDGAVADMLSKDKDGAQQDLNKQASSGNQMIAATLVQTPSNISSDVTVGAQASNVNVKVTAGYTALAVVTAELDKFLSAQALKQAGPSNQVYDSGVGNAQFTVAKPAAGAQTVAVTSNASVGPRMDTAAIASAIKGKKYGDANDYLNKLPGVDHATISISPGWGTSLPSRTSKIKITVKVAGG